MKQYLSNCMGLILSVLCLAPATSFADILTVDFVRVLNGNDKEAVYYYEQNWKQYRMEALQRGYISSYQMLVRTSDEGESDILLLTGYGSEAQFENREANFAIVMNRGDSDGPRLLNDKEPAEFREVFDGGDYTDQ